MKILADSVIPWVDKLFSNHGEIARYSGREIDRLQLDGVDILLIRSTLKITKDLLKGTSVKLVGSATVGCDHVDQNALKELGITFAYAPGCNANAVSEYVVSAVAWHEKNGVISFGNNLTAAVIGCGRIGSKVKQKLEILGFNVAVNDPPLEQSIESPDKNSSVIPAQAGIQQKENSSNFNFVNLSQALQADVICLHTPLTRSGAHPTHHLLDAQELIQINPKAILINAGRGEVINNSALLKTLDTNPNLNVVLDVWENEPDINLQLLNKVNLGTPHIAGHSWRGKVMGTVMLYEQASKHFGWPPNLIDEGDFRIPVQNFKFTNSLSLYDVVLQCFNIENDTRSLRTQILESSEDESAKQFDQFRKNYYQRAEFSDLEIKLLGGYDGKVISKLGFNVSN